MSPAERYSRAVRAAAWFVLLAAFAVLTALSASDRPALAAGASRLVKIVVPFAAGGGTDLIARTLADDMARTLGHPVIVENRAGAGTILGSSAVAHAAPDGHTLLMASFAHAVNPSLNPKLPYDTFAAFVPVALVARSFNIVVTNPDHPYRTLQQLIAAAKTEPGKINFGSFGIGTSAHLAGELFKALAGVDLVHVPYKGAAPAITDLLGGQIDVIFTTSASVAAHIQNGTLRPLAVTSAERVALYPDLPTVAECGVPGYVAESWYGVFAPANTPRDTVRTLAGSVQHAMHSQAFARVKELEGLTLQGGGPEELDAYVRAEAERWRSLIMAAGIRIE
ncbi:tripartite tricarboxylate transporter substrate binding protein [Xanthobacteraceae bacterium Astr-EGSB]|uniref:tripartite tricarboxylate transporter substrate binding protein n=1 Tax=Astrobacterium formosum TaxID=3069710 RepID=UPI0027B68F63|nr:tripartite tricarboxylate transporter substrate binding protein [Xanthobacteraceae bacterium Astr-EGSB]